MKTLDEIREWFSKPRPTEPKPEPRKFELRDVKAVFGFKPNQFSLYDDRDVFTKDKLDTCIASLPMKLKGFYACYPSTKHMIEAFKRVSKIERLRLERQLMGYPFPDEDDKVDVG